MKRSQLLSCVIIVVGLALGTSASGASGFSPHQALAAPLLDEPQLFVTDRVAGKALAGTTLYWHTSCGDEFSPPHSRLRSKPTNSSADSYSTLYYRECPAAAADRVSSANVALDGTYAYWLAGDGRVLRLPRSASRGDTPTQLSRTVQRAGVGGFPSCCAIAVDNDYIFWNEDKKVYRVAKSGGTGTLIYDGATDDPSPGTRLHDLRAGGDGSVYLLLGNRLTVLRPAVAGYTRRVIGTSSTVTTAYALDNSRIYWAATTGARYVVMSQARDFTGLRTHYTYSGPGALSVDNLAVDATNIYWHDHGSRSGRIYRLARGEGATPVALTADLLIGSPLLADGQYLFWTDYNTGIYRLQVNAAPVAPANGDIWITGMEVTQAIQTSDNRIPLVGNKVTVVRVYVRSREDSNGRWNGVRARLDVSGSSRTHSSRGIDIPAAGSNRRTLDDSFYFLLHREETAPDVPGRPGRDLSATIFPPLGRPEADTSNNTLTIHVNFGPSRSLTLWGYTYANINNGPECTGGGYGANGYTPPFANFEAHRQYAENAYPLSTLNLLPLSGSGTHSYDNRDCGAYLRAHDGAVALFDMNWPMGAVRGLVMQPDNERLAGWCCNSSRGNQIMRFQDFRPLPGVSVAHELSHSFGGVFGNCHTFDPCMRYPRPDPRPIPPATLPPNAGSIGPEVGLRLYPTPHAVPGEDPRGATTTWDIMSYHPGANWVSPYTYCKLLNYMSRGSVLCPSTVEGGGVESGGMLSTHIGDFSTFTAAGAQSSSDNGGIRLDPAGQPLTFLYIAGAIDDAGKAS
ncbi:MAG TPA: hypothetical protein VEY08_15910, partial [Chloroflexia bacterium]|nr:hypothetical protein [Chloroflexia bacterium]